MSYRNVVFLAVCLVLAAGCKPADTPSATSAAPNASADKAPPATAPTPAAPGSALDSSRSKPAADSSKTAAEKPSSEHATASEPKNTSAPVAKSDRSAGQKLVGSWNADNAGHPGSAAVFTFGKDGSMSIDADNMIGGKTRHVSMAGTYKVDGDVITVKFTSAKASATGVTAEEQAKIDQGNAQTNAHLKDLAPAHIHLQWQDDNTAKLTYEVPKGARPGTQPGDLVLKRKS